MYVFAKSATVAFGKNNVSYSGIQFIYKIKHEKYKTDLLQKHFIEDENILVSLHIVELHQISWFTV